MKNRLKRILTGILLVCVMMSVIPAGRMVSWAANTRIAFSDPSVMVGNEVTVTMKITSDSVLGKAEVMLSYDPAILEFVSGTDANGGAGAIKITAAASAADQKAFTSVLKFKALLAGTTQITVSSQEIYDGDSQIVNVDQLGTSSVKVTSPATSSKDSALSSLKISPGVLSPGFSPEVVSYTAEVNGSTASLVVNAVAANAGASVALEGADNLQIGENNVIVRVTAEDRETTTTYTITVNKLEGETAAALPAGDDVAAELTEASVTIGSTTYSVASSFDSGSLPKGFGPSTYSYKGNDVMAGTNVEKDLLVLYLQDESGNGGFYLYQESTDSFSQYVELEIGAKAIVIVPMDAEAVVPDGFTEQTIEVDGKLVTGWVDSAETEPQSCLFYGMNEAGETHFYRYDLTEMTVQRFFPAGVSNAEHQKLQGLYEELKKDYNLQFYMLIGIGALALILLVLIVVLLYKRGGRPGPSRKTRAEEEMYDWAEVYDESKDNESRDGRREKKTPDDELKEAADLDQVPDRRERAYLEDDFESGESLDDVERQLRNRLAMEADQAAKAAVQKPEVRGQRTTEEEDEDDFEIMDLDD